MTARDIEAALLARCTAIATDAALTAQDQREANVFQTAAMLVRSQFPGQSKQLMRASEQYFARYPHERLAPVEVVRHGWITSLPRLRDLLTRQLCRH